MIKITNERPKWLTSNFIKWFAIGVGVTLTTGYIICDALQFGNVQYAIKGRECGGRPVSIYATNLSLGGNQRLRYEILREPGWFDQKAGFAELYCSVDEAKASTTGNPELEVK